MQEADGFCLTVKGIAQTLKVSIRHVERMEAAGNLGPSPVRLGRVKRWIKSEILDWIRAGCPSRDRWEALSRRKEGSHAK